MNLMHSRMHSGPGGQGCGVFFCLSISLCIVECSYIYTLYFFFVFYNISHNWTNNKWYITQRITHTEWRTLLTTRKSLYIMGVLCIFFFFCSLGSLTSTLMKILTRTTSLVRRLKCTLILSVFQHNIHTYTHTRIHTQAL